MGELKPIAILIPYIQDGKTIKVWGQKRISQDDLCGLWEFPGGKVEPNESFIQAIIRETEEETGVCLVPDKLVRFGDYIFGSIVLTVFLYPDSDSQFSSVGWRDLADLLNDPTVIPPNNKQIIEDFNKRFQ